MRWGREEEAAAPVVEDEVEEEVDDDDDIVEDIGAIPPLLNEALEDNTDDAVDAETGGGIKDEDVADIDT